MKVNEIRVIFESEDIIKTREEVSKIFYDFGATGLKIEEPLLNLNPLDYYRDAKEFSDIDNAVSAYYPGNFYSEKRNIEIKKKLSEIFDERDDVVYNVSICSYEEEDYQNSWKHHLFPEKISERFVVKPTWREYTSEDSELVIELDPGRAFGTGSHSTTSLCVKIMEEQISENNISVLDIGTGSGILMIVAAKLGAKKVVGIDIDELAVEVAQENMELNKIDKTQFEVIKGDLISSLKDEKFDFVVANILSDVILLLLQDISKVIKIGGKIILSGIIDEKEHRIVKEIEKIGYKILEIKKEKEWRAILVQA
ncbi:MAG: 50S ribosomal protein L11 methyltransferase [Fusobacteriaceae bacterium]